MSIHVLGNHDRVGECGDGKLYSADSLVFAIKLFIHAAKLFHPPLPLPSSSLSPLAFHFD